jgi:hypothetical protein
MLFNQKINNLPKIYFLGLDFLSNFDIPLNVKELRTNFDNILLNNLPKHIEKLYIYFNTDITKNKIVGNLPLTLKEIVIHNEIYEKYVKIPFGSILTIE